MRGRAPLLDSGPQMAGKAGQVGNGQRYRCAGHDKILLAPDVPWSLTCGRGAGQVCLRLLCLWQV
ncbi:hypothetical protein GCM10011341_27400 [Frigidibacter albus]|nr:hypothetical protein GCM10011341_27400 [Frigidibacter albus]